MNIGQINIHNGANEYPFYPADFKISYDSLAGPQSGRSIDGEMHIDWILRKVTKLEITLPPHKYDDPTFSYIAQAIQGQIVTVDFFDYLSQTYRTDVEMYCSQVSAGYSYKGLVNEVSFELIEMEGENAWDIPTITLYTITVNGGTGSGEYTEDTWISLIAQPEDGYMFISWSDGNTQNPRPYLVTEDATFTANFVPKYVTLTATGSNCTITGTGTYQYGTTVTLTCTPDTGYEFASWSDGNTDNPRSITLTSDMSLTANLNRIYVTLTATGSNCTFTGTGIYPRGTLVTLTCIPDTGYEFTVWSDGTTYNPKYIQLNYDMTITAYTSEITVFVDATGNHCTFTGTGTYRQGTLVTLTCIPDTGYTFTGWSDGNTDNPRTFTATEDVTLTATTEYVISDYFWVKILPTANDGTFGYSDILYVGKPNKAKTLYYSFDKTNWSEMPYNKTTPQYVNLPKNTKVYFKGGPESFCKVNAQSALYGVGLRVTEDFEVGGSLSSLFEMYEPISYLPNWALYSFLREDNTTPHLCDASQLVMPNYTGYSCYDSMFRGCTKLIGCPTLPATALHQFCYSYMFKDCSSLTKIPTLPATALLMGCYSYMFNGALDAYTTSGSGRYSYRIPYSGTATQYAGDSTQNMFTNITPDLHTTYYVNATPVS